MSIGNSTETILPNTANDIDVVKNSNLEHGNQGGFLTDGLQKIHTGISSFLSKNSKKVKVGVKFTIFAAFIGYFGWATYYFVNEDLHTIDETSCTGYGFLMIMTILIAYGVAYSTLIKPMVLPVIDKHAWQPTSKVLARVFEPWYMQLGGVTFVFAAFMAYIVFDSSDNYYRLMPLCGISTFLLFGFLCSKHPGRIRWRPVYCGLFIQLTFGLLTIRWEVGRNVFGCAGDKVTTFLSYAKGSSAFVYGNYLVFDMQIFAFSAISTIYFLGFIINILYHYGIMQKIVVTLGEILQNIMGTSICESVNSAANIFLGQSEAPLLLGPYLENLTASEIHSVMTSGFATVSGTVLAAYITFGAKASHLITASVMAAPAALCYSKLMYPETESSDATAETISKTKSQYKSALDAASQGASMATQIVLGIIANLIAFIAFVYFINGVLGWMGELVGYTDPDDLWSLDRFVGYIFTPISFLMGVPWEECQLVGKLIGLKSMVNEFVAFEAMGKMDLSPRTKVISTFAICGFANPGSIGLMISVLGTLMPKKGYLVTDVAVRAFISGSITCFMTACIAGLLIPDDLSI